MKTMASVLMIMVFLAGCSSYKPHEPRVNLPPGVRSDTIESNIITRPIGNFVSFICGEGIIVDEVREVRTPEGFLEVQVRGYNQSVSKKRFDYKAQWLDGNGMAIDSVMSKWMTLSVTAKTEFRFKVTAPSTKAMDYRINTRVANYMDK